MTVRGIDASKWQRGIDLRALADSGFEFVALRATMGAAGIDPAYATLRHEGEGAGLFVISYHLEYPDEDPIAQVKNLVRVAGEGPYAIDVEPPDDHPPSPIARWRETTQGVCYEASARAGMPPLVYGSHDHLDSLGLADDIAGCPLWGTRWGEGAAPRVPRPWRRATIWQTGTILAPGPSPRIRIDVNEAAGTLDDLKRELLFRP